MKKTIAVFITVLITILLILIAFSFCIKGIIINTLNKQVVSVEVSSKLTNYLKNNNVSEENINKVDKIINDTNSTYLITEKYFDEIVRAITEKEGIKVPNIKNEVLNILNESNINMEENEKELLVEQIIGNKELSKIYKEVSNDIIKNVNHEYKKIIKWYSIFIKNEFRIITIIVLIILIVLLDVIKKSLYKPIINISISLLISGVFLSFAIPEIVSFIINDMISSFGHYEININSLINVGYIYLLIFSILILIYIIILKVKDKIENKQTSYS